MSYISGCYSMLGVDMLLGYGGGDPERQGYSFGAGGGEGSELDVEDVVEDREKARSLL